MSLLYLMVAIVYCVENQNTVTAHLQSKQLVRFCFTEYTWLDHQEKALTHHWVNVSLAGMALLMVNILKAAHQSTPHVHRVEKTMDPNAVDIHCRRSDYARDTDTG